LGLQKGEITNVWSNIPRLKTNISALLSAENIVVFDTETTGLRSTDKIIQLSAVKMRVNKDTKGAPLIENEKLSVEIISTFNQYINPYPNYISQEVQELTGITNEMVRKEPKENEIIPQFLSWCGENFVFMGHNTPFDVGKLNAAMERVNVASRMFDAEATIDTLPLARALLKLSHHRLVDCCEALNIISQEEEFHNALFDVEMTAELGCVLIAKLLKEKPQNGGIRPLVFGFSEFVKSKNVNRVYVTTSVGQLYYDRISHLWGGGTAKSPVDIEKIDMEYIDALCQKICDEKGIKSISHVKGKVDVPYDLRKM